MSCRRQPCPLPPACPEPGFAPVPVAPQAGQCCPQYTCGESGLGVGGTGHYPHVCQGPHTRHLRAGSWGHNQGGRGSPHPCCGLIGDSSGRTGPAGSLALGGGQRPPESAAPLGTTLRSGDLSVSPTPTACNASHCPALAGCPEGALQTVRHEDGACCPSQKCGTCPSGRPRGTGGGTGGGGGRGGGGGHRGRVCRPLLPPRRLDRLQCERHLVPGENGLRVRTPLWSDATRPPAP